MMKKNGTYSVSFFYKQDKIELGKPTKIFNEKTGDKILYFSAYPGQINPNKIGRYCSAAFANIKHAVSKGLAIFACNFSNEFEKIQFEKMVSTLNIFEPKWKNYYNEQYGYELQYPPYYEIHEEEGAIKLLPKYKLRWSYELSKPINVTLAGTGL